MHSAPYSFPTMVTSIEGKSPLVDEVALCMMRSGLSTSRLAEKAGVSPSVLTKVLDRTRECPANMAVKLLDAMGYEWRAVRKRVQSFPSYPVENMLEISSQYDINPLRPDEARRSRG